MPHPMDIHVGARIRERRTTMAMSQSELGAAINVSFQQVQKYERGTNRVSASRLWQIAKTLQAPISFFFTDYRGESIGEDAQSGLDIETLSLVRAYRVLPRQARQAIRKMVVGLSDTSREAPDRVRETARLKE